MKTNEEIYEGSIEQREKGKYHKLKVTGLIALTAVTFTTGLSETYIHREEIKKAFSSLFKQESSQIKDHKKSVDYNSPGESGCFLGTLGETYSQFVQDAQASARRGNQDKKVDNGICFIDTLTGRDY